MLEAGIVVEDIGVQVKPEGQPGTVLILREFRYAVVEAEGARRVAKTVGETDPPLEENEIV